MFLADFGADVIRIEASGGAARRSDPGLAAWDRGKRSVATTGSGPAPASPEAAALGRHADAVLLDGPDRALAGTAFDLDQHRAAAPAAVLVHLGPFTGEAPWAGGVNSEALGWAASGLGVRQASYDGGPVEMIVPCLSVIQGAWAAAAAVAALRERLTSGQGQVVSVSGIHAAGVAGAAAFTFDASAPEPARNGPRLGGPGGPVPFYRPYRCADGKWLFLAALTPHFSQRAFAVLGMAGITEDRRLDGGGRAAILRPENAAWVIEEMAAVFSGRPRSDWLDALAAAGCPAGPLLSREDWLDHPQVAAIGLRAEIEDPLRGRVVMPGVTLNLTASPARVNGPAPAPGSTPPDTWEDGPDRNAATPAAPAAPAAADSAATHPQPGAGGPLRGVRVVDLGAIIAGPFAGSLLAELGAEVMKVEPPAGDSFRGPGFAAYNKGQRGVSLDLQQPAGRDALLRLVEGADVVIDNYRPGVLGRLRLTHADLAAVNPDIITLTITGFGTTGPLGAEAGFDPVLQAMSGMMTAQGGDSEPVFLTVPVNDVTAAAVSALGVCLALLHRSRGGGGQHVWTSLAAMSALLQTSDLVRYPGRPEPRRGGRDHRGPSGPESAGPEAGADAGADGFFPTADGWVRVQSQTPAQEVAARLGGAGAPLSRVLAGLETAAVLAGLTSAGIPAVGVPSPRDLAGDDQLAGFGFLRPDPRPDRAGWWTSHRLARFSRTETGATLVAPGLGQHTREVLAGMGLSEADLNALIGSGAAVAAPEASPPKS